MESRVWKVEMKSNAAVIFHLSSVVAFGTNVGTLSHRLHSAESTLGSISCKNIKNTHFQAFGTQENLVLGQYKYVCFLVPLYLGQ
jgi:hypothetical protein